MCIARRLLIVPIALLLLGPALTAQDAQKPTDPPEFKALKYRPIGPAAGGRVARVAGIAGDPTTYYAAAASGGVWKSSDGGATWKSVFDDQPVSSTGSIAVAPSDPNVVYVGSGEANIRGNVAAGNGIYKSVDAGKTWKHVWKQEGQIGTMVVHPSNPDIAFAAVLGHAFGPNPERGVYRTTDGGATWQQVLKKDADTGASSVSMDPSNPSILFAGFWQARRLPWDLVSGGPGSGLYVSRDGGSTWKPLTGNGLPEGIWGKVAVAVAPSDGRRVYALIEADKGGLYRSDDGGENWERTNASRALSQRAWYYTTITVNPVNREDVWFPQVPMLHSIDGGKTLDYVKGIHHGDHHDIWIDPKNPRRMISANDGGVDITTNGGETWFAPPLPINQFYHVATDTHVPYRVEGAMQDLGTAQGPSRSLRGAIALTDWHRVGGGEAGYVVSDAGDPNIVYAGEYLGIITRFDERTGESRNVSAWPENPSGHGGEDMRYRFQWTAPIALSPHDPKVIYHGAQVILRTIDGGQSWETISPDLTRNDKTKQKWAGGPITGDNTGVETYGTVFAIAESPKQKGVIWAGSDDGLVHVTRDAGAHWADVTAAMPGVPEWGTVSMIEPSPFDAAAAYVVVDAHRLDNMHPYVYKTADFGRSWTRLDGALPQDVYLHAVREDPAKAGLLYLGTERGVMFSADEGRTWRPLKLNLPTVAVHDLVVKGHDLIVGTHGRSVWILDDLQPVREMSGKVAGEDVHLFPVADAIRWRYGSRPWGTAATFENPPRGASIYYFLKEKPKGELKIEILAGDGRLVRTLSSVPREPDYSSEEDKPEDFKKRALPADAGVQRAVWDLAWEGAKKIKGGKIDTGDPTEGPRAVPGTYTVRLSVDGRTATSPLRVAPDPRGSLPPSDLEAQLQFALRVRDDISRLTGLVNQVRSVRDQLQARARALDSRKGEAPVARLLATSDAVVKKADGLEDRLHNPTAEVVYDILAMRGGTRLYSRLAPLQMWAVEADGPPTTGMRQVLEIQEKELSDLERETTTFIMQDVAELNQAAAQLGLPFVIVR
ncbi:MAG: hypothetical protein A3G21_10070 [Acidobacteria bacterium RIFCSPLOWO2_12_FULL_66_21]|nr:MAG: hypothetical protein A3G21_10070 [Acidobacteria bacterium RIFCSPLOWO2_12_FULL_66_21]